MLRRQEIQKLRLSLEKRLLLDAQRDQVNYFLLFNYSSPIDHLDAQHDQVNYFLLVNDSLPIDHLDAQRDQVNYFLLVNYSLPIDHLDAQRDQVNYFLLVNYSLLIDLLDAQREQVKPRKPFCTIFPCSFKLHTLTPLGKILFIEEKNNLVCTYP